MLSKQYPLPVKFICGFIYSSQDAYVKVKDSLRRKFGHIDFESDKIEFNFTDYYFAEMGPNLYRRFISFAQLKDPGVFVKK